MGLRAPRFDTFPGDMLNLCGDLAMALALGERGEPCRRFTGFTGDLYFLPGVSATICFGVHKPLAKSLLVTVWLNKVLFIWGVCGTASVFVQSLNAANSLPTSISFFLSLSLVGVQQCSIVSKSDWLMSIVCSLFNEGGLTGV